MLKCKIKEKGYELNFIAGNVKLDEDILSKKIESEIEFSVSEAIKISEVLSLSYREIVDIFFS